MPSVDTADLSRAEHNTPNWATMREAGLSELRKMEPENAAEEMTSSPVSSLIPLASASQQPYVSELLSFTLDRLHKVLSLPLWVSGILFMLIKFLNFFKEPELLRVDAERIRRQMQEVAVGNYRAFIAAADALFAIREEVSSISNHLESLVIFSFFYWFVISSFFRLFLGS